MGVDEEVPEEAVRRVTDGESPQALLLSRALSLSLSLLSLSLVLSLVTSLLSDGISLTSTIHVPCF